MKRLFTSFTFLFILIAFSAQAQWSTQWLGYTTAASVKQISIVDNTTAWMVPSDASNPLIPWKIVSKTTNSGSTWQQSTIPANSSWFTGAIFGLNSMKAWVCMQNPADTGGKIYVTSNGGSSWASQDSAIFHVNPKIIYFWDADSGVCIGNPYNEHFEIYTTKDGGADWNSVDASDMPGANNSNQTFANSFWTKGDTMWFGGYTEGRIFVSHDRGYHWSFIPLPVNNVPFVFFRDTVGIAGNNDFINNDNEFYKTTDNGKHWTKVACDGLTACYSLTYVPGTPGTLVSVGTTMMVSNDWGESWNFLEEPLTNPSFVYSAVSFYNLTTGWAGGENLGNPSAGGIYKYNGSPLNLSSHPEITDIPELFPNPANGFVTIAFNSPRSQITSIDFSDITGRLVFHSELQSEPGSFQKNIDISMLQAGIYMARLQLGNKQFVKKLIVK